MKTFLVLYTPEATQQIKHIAIWYHNISNGLGERFKVTLYDSIEKLRNNPFIPSFRYDKVR